MATLGYTSIGASTYTAGTTSGVNNPAGLLVTLSVRGVFSTITAYVNGTVATKNTSCSIRAGSAGSRGALISTTNLVAVTTTPGWVDFPFASPLLLDPTTYWIEFAGYGGDGPGTNVDQIKFDTGGPSNTSYAVNDFGTPVYGTSQYSMYATYEQYIPPVPASGILLAI